VKSLSLSQHSTIQSALSFDSNVPFFKKNVYYLGAISNSLVLYQLFLMTDSKNLYSHELSDYDSINSYFKIFDDSLLHFNVRDFKNVRELSLYGYTKNIEVLYNNLPLLTAETNPAKNPIDFDEVAETSKDLYKSHHVNTYIYVHNRSGKYLSSGVPLNNAFSSSRFINIMAADVKDTFSFYDVFSIFLSNIFSKNDSVKGLGDPSTYVMLSEPFVASFLVKLGSYNHCQHSLENGP